MNSHTFLPAALQAGGKRNRQCGFKGLAVPLLFACLPHGVDYSSVAKSSSFQTKIGLLVGKAPLGSVVLERGFARLTLWTLSWVTSNSVLPPASPWQFSTMVWYGVQRHLQSFQSTCVTGQSSQAAEQHQMPLMTVPETGTFRPYTFVYRRYQTLY